MLVCLAAACRLTAQSPALDFPVTENDTLRYTLRLMFDSAGNPDHFYREIFTPVCFTGECKPVYINFYWDLLGNYLRYDLPPGEVLTKMDHKEFTEDDYVKLREILANPSSLLGDVAVEDLVTTGTDNLADSVDAKTGATPKTIKKEVIEGAVYTCYTLWHIAYGKTAVDKMREITESIKTPELLHRFLKSGHHHYQYWATDQVLDKDGVPQEAFIPEIRLLVGGDNVFLSKNVLNRLNPLFFEKLPEQEWLLGLYRKVSYPMQLAILRKLESVRLQPATLTMLAEAIPQSNAEQLSLILRLFSVQDRLPGRQQRELSELLLKLPEQKSGEVGKLLARIPLTDRQAKKNLNIYNASRSKTFPK